MGNWDHGPTMSQVRCVRQTSVRSASWTSSTCSSLDGMPAPLRPLPLAELIGVHWGFTGFNLMGPKVGGMGNWGQGPRTSQSRCVRQGSLRGASWTSSTGSSLDGMPAPLRPLPLAELACLQSASGWLVPCLCWPPYMKEMVNEK